MRDLIVVHSSDLHIDGNRSEEFHPLCKVLDAARAVTADMLLLAGDIFEHNRLPLSLLDRAARLLDDAGIPVVILPGNHDCLVPDSVYRRGGIADVPGAHVLGVSADDRLLFPEHDLEVWGRPHLDYGNMSPLREPPAKAARRRIAMAHGHWLSGSFDLHRSWLIRDEEIAAAGADYVALGHWPQALPVGDGRVPAYYSGSPDLARTINLVRLKANGSVEVRRLPLGP